MLQNDPQQFIRTVSEAMREAGMSTDDLFPEEPEEEPGNFGGIPREYTQRMDNMEKMMGNFFNQFQGYTQQQSEAQQMQELDKLMADMHTKHGEFDDDWVLLQIEKGLDPEKAVEAWNKNIVQKFGSPRKAAANLLPSNGAIRQDQVDPSKLDPKQRKDYALQILKANLE